MGVFSSLHISVCENVEQQHDQGGEGSSQQDSSLLIVTYKIMEDVFQLKNENRVMKDENRDLRKTVAELQNTILHLESQAKGMVSLIQVRNSSKTQTNEPVSFVSLKRKNKINR